MYQYDTPARSSSRYSKKKFLAFDDDEAKGSADRGRALGSSAHLSADERLAAARAELVRLKVLRADVPAAQQSTARAPDQHTRGGAASHRRTSSAPGQEPEPEPERSASAQLRSREHLKLSHNTWSSTGALLSTRHADNQRVPAPGGS